MKELIEWSNDLSVNIQEIDEQHKILVALLNKLYASIITSDDQTVIHEVLTELTQYTIIHFAVEESLMRIFHYPDYKEHKQQHAELTQQVIDLKNKVTSGKTQISMETLDFLRQWLTRHIMGEDRKYVTCFLEHGMEKTWAKRSWMGRIWGS